MNCPGCSLEMTAHRFPANYGGEVEIDICEHCNGIWFDGRESLQLTPGATLDIFRILYSRNDSAKATHVPQKRCPRCSLLLVETHDMQRGSKFTYSRCAHHGRFSTFFQFLKEKGLVRQPNPKELADLIARVKIINCSNCGAPIDLHKTTACKHCSAPVTILSEDRIKETLHELSQKEEKRTTIAPDVGARIVMAQLQAEREYRKIHPDGADGFFFKTNDYDEGSDLLVSGAKLLVKMLFRIG